MIDYEKLNLEIEEILKSYSHKKFKLAIRLPFQLPIRLHSLNLENKYLSEKIEISKFKEIVKNLVNHDKQDEECTDCMITLGFDHEESINDYKFLVDNSLLKNVKKKVKKGKTSFEGLSIDRVIQALSKTTPDHFKAANLLPPPVPRTLPTYSLTIHTSSIYIAGRYNKLSRHISNSKWIINGTRITPDSIEELVGIHLSKFFNNQGYKFSSAGREDSDVLMLGTGRPFYFEILQPKVNTLIQDDIDKLQTLVNESGEGKILIRDLQIVTKADTDVLKQSASTKRKSYKCVISLSKPVEIKQLERISDMVDLVIQQRNPTRVPRRADLVREKTVHCMSLKPLTPTLVAVELVTSAGLYVKEFMHGDEGRTLPCISGMLDCQVKVVSLDVLGVELDWPERRDDYEECERIVEKAVRVDEEKAREL